MPDRHPDAQLARLVHGAAVFGAPPEELVHMARRRVDVLRRAMALVDPHDRTPGVRPSGDVLTCLRRAVALATERDAADGDA